MTDIQGINGVVKGKVKTVNSRGFGFIASLNNEIDFFFHYSNFNGNWKELVMQHITAKSPIFVEFEVDKTAKEPKALNVRVITEDQTEGKTQPI